jgi:hypothetical protein
MKALVKMAQGQQRQILTVLQDWLGLVIANDEQLCQLFGLSLVQFPEAPRRQIWSTLKERLYMLVDSNFCILFDLPEKYLTVQQRTQIIEAKKGYLGTHCIQNGYQLARVLSLPATKLTEEQRRLIWDDVLPALENMYLADHRHLLRLPEPYITMNQRKQVLTAMMLSLCQELLNNPHLPVKQTVSVHVIRQIVRQGDVNSLREHLEQFANSVKTGDAESFENPVRGFIRNFKEVLIEIETFERQLEYQGNSEAFRI